MSKEIYISDGSVAYVDDCDLLLVAGYFWAPDGKGYIHTRIERHPAPKVKMHKLIGSLLGYSGWIDHRDGNKLNNCRDNLRPTNNSFNQANSKIRKGRKYKGVSVCGSKFLALIIVNGEIHRLGLYEKAWDAALAYDEAAKLYFGEHALTNGVKKHA